MDLQQKVIEAIKEDLGELELQALEQLLADSRKLKTLQEVHNDKCLDLQTQTELLEAANKDRTSLEIELREAKTKIDQHEKTNEMLQRQINSSELDHAVHTAKQLQADKEALLSIVSNAYKHYTHTTTRTVALDGGTSPGPYHYDNMGNPVESTPIKNPDVIADAIEKTEVS